MNQIKSSIKVFAIILVMMVSVNKVQSQVSIGVPVPSGSAMLDVSSTTKGFLPPRMSEIQRVLILKPDAGLIVYQTDGKKGLYYYDGSSWTYVMNQFNAITPNETVVAIGGGANDGIATYGTVAKAPTPVYVTSEWLNVGGYSVYLKNKRMIYGNDFDGTAALTSNLLSAGITSSTTLAVGTNATITGTLTVGGVTTINNNATISGNLNVSNINGVTIGTGNSTNNNNIGIGSGALNAISGNRNTAVGKESLSTAVNASNNTAIGYQSLITNQTGDKNTAIGSGSDVGSTNLKNATAIGYNAIVNSSNTIQLGDANVTSVNTSGTITAGGFNGPLTGNAITATTAGNITATTNTTLTSLSNLTSVGTLTSLTVSGTTTLNNTLAVGNNTTLSGTLTVASGKLTTLNGGLQNYGSITSTGTFINSGATALNNTLAVAGITTINNNATITGTTNIRGLLTTSGGITNTGSLINTGALTVNGNGTITGTLDIGGDLTVLGSITGTSSWKGDKIAIAYGGTNAKTAQAAITNLTGNQTSGHYLRSNGNNAILSALLASDLTGSTLSSTVTNSSLTSVGTLTSLTVTGTTALKGISNTGTITNTGSLINTGALTVNGNGTITGTLTLPSLTASTLLGTNGSSQLGTVSLTGDITTTGLVATLSNTGVISGTYGSSTAVPQITVDSKGRITTITTTSITASGGGTISHTIGESYGGGIVFYVYDNGNHGLIAATSDQSAGIRWNGGSYTNTRARADGVGAGLKNTALIIANQAAVDGSAFAATLCNEYTVTVDGVTYGDWYLPSKHELDLLYLQKTVVGGFANSFYWSSTEFDDDLAWCQYFNTGSRANYDKDYLPGYVRAIRAF